MKVLALLCVAATLAVAVSAGYDYSVAQSSLYWSKISYCNQSDIMSGSCAACSLHPGMSQQVVLQSTYETQVVVAKDGDHFVVAFRGSSNIGNWIADLDATHVPFPGCSGCTVHKGFFTAFNDLAPQISSALGKLKSNNGNLPVLVTGHSLGAALSWHCAVMLIKTGYTVKSLYNFGSPRVGNTNFVAYAANVLKAVQTQPTVRVTHYKDPVPHLPLEAMGYIHIPHETWYGQETGLQFVDCPDTITQEAKNCADSVFGDEISDHLHYLDVPTACTGLS